VAVGVRDSSACLGFARTSLTTVLLQTTPARFFGLRVSHFGDGRVEGFLQNDSPWEPSDLATSAKILTPQIGITGFDKNSVPLHFKTSSIFLIVISSIILRYLLLS